MFLPNYITKLEDPKLALSEADGLMEEAFEHLTVANGVAAEKIKNRMKILLEKKEGFTKLKIISQCNRRNFWPVLLTEVHSSSKCVL